MLVGIPLVFRSQGVIHSSYDPIVYTPTETSFQYSYRLLLEHEGNWVHHPDDKGGETYRGIARKFNPNWYGWRFIDKIKNKQRYQNIEDANFWVQDYYLDIWVKEGWRGIKDKEMAAYLFDFRINSYYGIREIKKVINTFIPGTPINNQFTVETTVLINTIDSHEFCESIRKHRVRYYNNIVYNHPKQAIFLKHWLQRTKIKRTKTSL